MKIAIGIAGTGPSLSWEETVDFVREAESLGVDFAWSSEAWIRDAFTPLAYLAACTSRVRLGTAIAVVGTRTPGMLAMTAMTLSELSQGRFSLGLGASGPQVIEAVHGFEFAGQLGRIEESAAIVRKAFAGERLEYVGKYYALPRPGGAASRALRVGPRVSHVAPIYVGAMSPAGLRLTGRIADGWIGHHFVPEAAESYLAPLREGADAAGRALDSLDLQAGGWVEFGEDLDALIDSRRAYLAHSIGAMGTATKNYYHDVYARAGFEVIAREIQSLWLAGERDKAVAAVPDELVLQSQLIGNEARLRERVDLMRSLGIRTLRVQPAGSTAREQLETLERTIAVVRSLDD
ncbi:MAG: LLM class flavin-dependent oxidoreductase [Deltaproteobacteria bacterium]|jgi:F420-dependent oxidoreductase-like protein|nr:LLM class flavin-dependent oxidoreductase [Deltaproteobacteria bacterium]